MRITNSMTTSATLHDLNRSLERLQDRQADLSTGRVIRRVSDDPTGASSAMSLRSQLRRNEQHQRAQSDAKGWLSAADSAVVSGLDLMSRLKGIVVQASSSGSLTPESRQALASEVTHLRDELLTLANTTYLDRSVFNGTAGGPAYDSSGTFVGNDAAVTREIAPGTSMQVNVTGTEIFGDPASASGDVFAVLDRLATAIRSSDAATIEAEHTNLDDARATMSAAAGRIGARGSRLEAIGARTANDEIIMRDGLSELEDTDLAEALISVKAQENAYTAALQAAAKILPPSLLDYMR